MSSIFALAVDVPRTRPFESLAEVNRFATETGSFLEAFATRAEAKINPPRYEPGGSSFPPPRSFPSSCLPSCLPLRPS